MAKKSSLSFNKLFEKHIASFTSKGSDRHRVFSDFLELTVCAFTKHEELYEKIKKRYAKEEMDRFSRALADLVTIEQEREVGGIVSDYLGDFYMEHITYGEHGQYFTPMNIADLSAQLTVEDREYDMFNKCIINDPACGSGRMALATAKIHGQRHTYAILQDLDRRCALMAYINMVLSGIDCEIYQCDSLLQKYTDGRSFKLRAGAIPRGQRIVDLPEYKQQPQMQSLF